MGMKNFIKGNFIPKNPGKYVGTYPITYRSSWELRVMKVFDGHPYVLQWASEGIAIPYYNPVLERPANYFPDFLIKMQNVDGVVSSTMIEVKPASQAIVENAKSKRDKLEWIVNMSKWKAAETWCAERGIAFKVMTEHDIFHTGSNTNKAKKKK
jgi:TnsA endonuclease N terminal